MKIMAHRCAGGLSACTKQPLQAIVPYVKQPKNLLPQASFLCHGHAAGVYGTGCWWRVTKASDEDRGNPQHPSSLAARRLQPGERADDVRPGPLADQ